MNPEDDPFYQRKTFKLKSGNEPQPGFKPVEDVPPQEDAPKHFKPIPKKTFFSPSNLLTLLIPLIVTAALGYGCYRGVLVFRGLALRADEGERKATAATTEATRMRQDIGRFDNEAANIDQTLPRLMDSFRMEARQKAESHYRAEMADLRVKIDTAVQDHANETTKKLAEAETIGATKVRAAGLEVQAAEKRIEALNKEADNLKTYLREHKRTVRPDF